MPMPALFDELRRHTASEVESGLALYSPRPRDANALGPGLHWVAGRQPPVVGFVVTVEMSGDAESGGPQVDNTDWWAFVQKLPGPKVVMARDVSATPGGSVMCGRLSAYALRAAGCVGFVTNGAVRDAVVLENIGFSALAGTKTVRHGSPHVVRYGNPVNFYGITASTGDVFFADRDGAVVFPASMLPDLPRAVAEVNRRLGPVLEYCRESSFTPNGLAQRIERHMKSAPKFQPGDIPR